MGGFVGDLLGTSKPSTSGQAASTAAIRDLEERMYDESVARSKPFYDVGVSGIQELSGLLGLGGGQPQIGGAYTMEDLTLDPSYQFRLGEGQKAMERAMSSQGKIFDPEYAKALGDYGQQMASQEYGAAFDRKRAQETDLYNRLLNMANIGTGQAGQLQQAGQTMSGRVGSALGEFGQVEDAADIAKRDARSSMFKTGVQAAMLFSDSRLKENIEHVGSENGHNVYRFSYKGGDKVYEGVMAQEVLKKNPEAVKVADNGYYMVNYDKIGLSMREVN